MSDFVVVSRVEPDPGDPKSCAADCPHIRRGSDVAFCRLFDEWMGYNVRREPQSGAIRLQACVCQTMRVVAQGLWRDDPTPQPIQVDSDQVYVLRVPNGAIR
jgi:hypothetical protein